MDNQTKYVPFHISKEQMLLEKLNESIKQLPEFCNPFFKELSRFENKATSTLLAYAMDLRIFFIWAKDYLPEYSNTELTDLPVDILSRLKVSDIKSFMLDYVPCYSTEIKVSETPDGEEIYKEIKRSNSKTTAARKLSTLKKFYHFYNNLSSDEKYHIDNDPVSSIKQVKDVKQEVKYLNDKDTTAVFACIESGEGLAGKSKKWNEKTRSRDKAIIALFLGTGIRVSELAGINIQDIDFDDNSIHVFRKEHRNDTVYMSDEVASALLSYINERVQIFRPDKENENALFLSFKHNRMSISAIERCVKKYTQVATGENGYSCHKLRDTFGTRIYAETGGNAKKVQTAMNHKSASTSLDYYVAAIEGKEKEDTFKKTHIEGL
ncbi:MAG: tyrosine-type recombinase/integrase [Bacteroidales bacterium]|nr:tyrosine-type recombinase/integrase [Bacteroidales bacterium]